MYTSGAHGHTHTHSVYTHTHTHTDPHTHTHTQIEKSLLLVSAYIYNRGITNIVIVNGNNTTMLLHWLDQRGVDSTMPYKLNLKTAKKHSPLQSMVCVELSTWTEQQSDIL